MITEMIELAVKNIKASIINMFKCLKNMWSWCGIREIQKNQLEILGMKNTIFEMKVSLGGSGCMFDTQKKKIWRQSNMKTTSKHPEDARLILKEIRWATVQYEMVYHVSPRREGPRRKEESIWKHKWQNILQTWWKLQTQKSYKIDEP